MLIINMDTLARIIDDVMDSSNEHRYCTRDDLIYDLRNIMCKSDIINANYSSFGESPKIILDEQMTTRICNFLNKEK